jgi:hypothetical protein
MASASGYWFPAKRYGWGWGVPNTWQGWVVLLVYAAALMAGAAVFPPKQDPVAFSLHVGALSVALIGVCWLKGEPPRWRWGAK